MPNGKISKISNLPSAANSGSDQSGTLIDVDELRVVRGTELVLDNVSLCIHEREFVGLIGPNGAGKTTLLRTMLGLIKPTSGTVRRDKGAVGYVPQRGSQQDTGGVPISVLEVARLGVPNDSTAAAEALEDVKMADFAERRFAELSGGQQQRVLIAKALAAKPKLLILDEPMTGVDKHSQAEFDQILLDLKDRGISIVMVSHDVEAVLAQVGRVICLNRGILYDGSPEHFEADKYMPKLYATQHRLLHHQHGGENA